MTVLVSLAFATMPDASPPTPKRWFIPRFSLRTFLVVTLVVGALLGPFVYKTRKQDWVAAQLANQGISFEITDPPTWLSFLPSSILDLGDGHWCRSIQKVELDLDSTEEHIASFSSRLKLLSELPRLSTLRLRVYSTLDGQDLQDKLAPMASIQGLQHIDLGLNCDFGSFLEAMPPLRTLRSMNTEPGANLYAIELEPLSKFPNLETVSFDNHLEIVGSLQPLADLSHLKHISLRGVFPPSMFECFTDHPALQSIELEYLTDESVRVFCSCPNMASITVNSSLVTDLSLSYLSGLKGLKTLQLQNPSISDSGFANLAACESLEDLYLSQCKLTDSIGPTLSEFTKLKYLGLDSTCVTDALMPHLYELKHLSYLNLGDTPVDIELAAPMKSQLQWSDTERWYPIPWEEVFYRFGDLPAPPSYFSEENLNLARLHGIGPRVSRIIGLDKVTNLDALNSDMDDDSLIAVAAASNLESVDVSYTPIGARGLEALSSETNLTKLTAGPFDDPAAAIDAISTLDSLKELRLLGASDLAHVDLTKLSNMTKLETLNLSGCPYDEELAIQFSQMPNLYHMRWMDLDVEPRRIDELRLIAARRSAGIPQGLQNRINEKPNLAFATVVDNSELQLLKGRFMTGLNLADVQLNSEVESTLREIHGVTMLDLSNTGITDDYFEYYLRLFRGLVQLNLSDNPITDQSVQYLIHRQRLQTLNLAGTNITDAGVSQIIQSLKVEDIDLSNTAITEKAWTSLTTRTLPPFRSITLNNVNSLGTLLRSIPLATVVDTALYTCDGVAVDRNAVLIQRGGRPPSALTSLVIVPALLQAWPPQELFHEKDRLTELEIHATGQLSDILNAAQNASSLLSKIELHRELFQTQPIPTFPKQLRTLSLHHCDLSTETLAALSQCQWLGDLEFTHCNITNCSLEPLRQMPYLGVLNFYATELTAEQKAVIGRLRPTLIETNVRP